MKTTSNILPALLYHLYRPRVGKGMAKEVMPKHPSQFRQKKNLSARKTVSVKGLMEGVAVIGMGMEVISDRISKD